ncbi:hypothetical protein MTP99_002934 [Tenebrio molitor]|nr:hypothetical protein MTP99_002934 [Tenebrio molitor]
MTFPPPRKPEIRPYLREEPRKVEEDFRFKFHQPERTRFPVSRLNLDHRRRKEGATERKTRRRRKPRRPTPPHREEEPSEGATLRDPPFPKKEGCVTKLLRKRSRWRKNSVLSPSRARKLARSRLPQPCPPNPPRNPCFFRPTISGLRAEQSSPTATAASQRPRAAIEAIKGPRRACRAHSDSGPISDSNSIPSTSRLLAPAPNRLPIHLRLRFRPPDFRPVRSPSERTRSSPVSGPFAPLVSEPGHPAHPVFPARSLP